MSTNLNTATQVLGETTPETDGSYTAATEALLPGVRLDRIEVSAEYVRGTAGGLPLFRFKWKIGGEWKLDAEPTGAANVAGNIVSTPVAITVVPGPAPADATALAYVFTIRARAGATALLVEVAEADATKATPGTINSIILSTVV